MVFAMVPIVMVSVKEKWGLCLTGFHTCCSRLSPALELLKNAIGKAGYTDKVVIGMDVAASEFFRSGKYDLDFKSPDDPSRYISPDELANLYMSFIKGYPGECSWGAVLPLHPWRAAGWAQHSAEGGVVSVRAGGQLHHPSPDRGISGSDAHRAERLARVPGAAEESGMFRSAGEQGHGVTVGLPPVGLCSLGAQGRHGP